jgi:hypothetical protein
MAEPRENRLVVTFAGVLSTTAGIIVKVSRIRKVFPDSPLFVS